MKNWWAWKIEVICAQKLTRSSFKATFFYEKVSFFAFFRGIHPVFRGLHLFFLMSCDLQAMTRGFWPISRARCTGSGNRNSLRKKLKAKKLTLRAQKCRFWAVSPNFERHLVVKISESGKSEMTWPRRLIWHPISLGTAPRTTLRAQKCRFGAVFPNFEGHLVVKISESGKSEIAWPRRLIWHPISLCRALNFPNPLSYKEAQPSVHCIM